MNLKEAFRYQNAIQTHLNTAQAILDCDGNITKTENTHLRKKVMPEAEDETLVVPETEYANKITEIVRFVVFLLQEKEKLAAAIRKAKSALDIDIDSQVGLNTARQSIARTFKHMNDLRNSEQLFAGAGVGYRFNAEGNQVSYRCDVKKVTTINYDRNVVRAELDKLNKKCDAISAQIDLCLVNSSVDYKPPFDINHSFTNVFEAFVEKLTEN